MAQYFIYLQVKKSKLVYQSAADRDQAFTRILNFFRTHGFTPNDVTLKRVDELQMRGIEDPTRVRNLEVDVEIQ